MAVLRAYTLDRVNGPQTVQELRPVWRTIVKRLDVLLSADPILGHVKAEETGKLRTSLSRASGEYMVSRKKSTATTSS